MTGARPDSLAAASRPLGRDAALAAENLRGAGSTPGLADFEELLGRRRRASGARWSRRKRSPRSRAPGRDRGRAGPLVGFAVLVFSSRPDELRAAPGAACKTSATSRSSIGRSGEGPAGGRRGGPCGRGPPVRRGRAIEGRNSSWPCWGTSCETRSPPFSGQLIFMRRSGPTAGLVKYAGAIDRQTRTSPAGRRSPGRRPGDLGKVSCGRRPPISGIWSALCRVAAADGGRVRGDAGNDADPHEPLMVDGDAVRLEQMVNNLLTNASSTRHGAAGYGRRGTRRGSGGASVADTGVGIEPDH